MASDLSTNLVFSINLNQYNDSLSSFNTTCNLC